MKTLRVFIGYDEQETVAYHVLAHSILRHAHVPVSITPVMRSQIEHVYTRPRGPLESTDFSLSRFLVPYLCNYEGHALFLDCDMLCQANIGELFFYALAYPTKAVQVVQHNYVPKSALLKKRSWYRMQCGCETWCVDSVAMNSIIKCDTHGPQGLTERVRDYPYEEGETVGRKFLDMAQTTYRRKNWSSVMLFNNALCTKLTPEYVNTATGLDLHQFAWLDDKQIGSLPADWNWLVGEYDENSKARILHYTLGTPCFTDYAGCHHADLWMREFSRMASPHLNRDKELKYAQTETIA